MEQKTKTLYLLVTSASKEENIFITGMSAIGFIETQAKGIASMTDDEKNH